MSWRNGEDGHKGGLKFDPASKPSSSPLLYIKTTSLNCISDTCKTGKTRSRFYFAAFRKPNQTISTSKLLHKVWRICLDHRWHWPHLHKDNLPNTSSRIFCARRCSQPSQSRRNSRNAYSQGYQPRLKRHIRDCSGYIYFMSPFRPISDSMTFVL